MKTIHLVGVHHNNPDETQLVRQIIIQTQPDVIFLEEGEERFEIIENNIKPHVMVKILQNRITKFTVRGRMVHRILSTQSLIDSIKSGTFGRSVDMKPAFDIGQKMNIDVIPIDMKLSTIMNKLGEETLNISNMRDFMRRFRDRMNTQAMRQEVDMKDLESLREYVAQNEEIVPVYNKVIVKDRNVYMIHNIDNVMNIRDVGVAVVGAAHVPGMLDGLREHGYNVEVHL